MRTSTDELPAAVHETGQEEEQQRTAATVSQGKRDQSNSEDNGDKDLVVAVREALRAVKDPEIPTLSLEELGMVHDICASNGRVVVRLIPTFVGCPAVELILGQVRRRVADVQGVQSVSAEFVMDAAWTSDMITEAGRAKLAEFGIAPPPRDFAPELAPQCPYCGAEETNVVSLFGPTACRAVFYCKSCQQPFEGMKYV